MAVGDYGIPAARSKHSCNDAGFIEGVRFLVVGMSSAVPADAQHVFERIVVPAS